MDVSGVRNVTTRAIRFERIYNFRDLRGLATAAGDRVQTGRLFRSGGLQWMTDADATRIRRGISPSSLVDLRGDREVERDGVATLLEESQRLHVPIDRDLDIEAILENNSDRLARVVTHLADDTAYPCVISCSSGVHRTSLVVTIVLDLLGVARDAIAEDFVASAGPYRDGWEFGQAMGLYPLDREQPPDADLQGETILDVVSTIDGAHGSTRDFLLAAGADPTTLDRLPALLLE